MNLFSKYIKRISIYLLVSVVLLGFFEKAEGQCKGFASRICKLDLEHFVHDGNFHAAILNEGEEAELYKTFYAGQDYRIAICGSDVLPDIEFRILDSQRNILYNNQSNDLKNIWDFRLESSQQLMITVKVPFSSNPPGEPKSGCVAILFGFSDR